jgi:hypothetical protein
MSSQEKANKTWRGWTEPARSSHAKLWVQVIMRMAVATKKGGVTDTRARCTGGSIPVLTAAKTQTLRIDKSSYRTRAKYSHEQVLVSGDRPLIAVWEDLAGHQSCGMCQCIAPAAVED